jgi:hypothetical protein
MSTPNTAGQPAEWSGEVISRVIKAFCGAYDMSRDAFAVACGINPRTFYRRLETGNFTANEVAKMASYMSRVGPDKVSIADVYAGRLSVYGSTEKGDGPDASTPPLPDGGLRGLTNPYLSDNVVVGPWSTPAAA